MVRPRRPGEQELTEGMRLLDRYTILDRIGSGGMATIYRATDDRLDRVVCIKLLRTTVVSGASESGDAGERAVYQATYAHFLQEALALSKLQHPNTLRIYDFGYLDEASPDPGAPFHVSEYLDGGNVETHIRLRGAIPSGEALGILESVCGALAEAHEHNIIHRDIKPSNILFARVRGALVAKVADFGIASSDLKKTQRTDGGFDATGSISAVALFSPRWAAPEQLCGAPEGPRTDVYALALLAIFMLTGQVLFGDDDVRVTFHDRVRGDTLVLARLAKLAIRGDVGRVFTDALKARASDRIASAPELFEQLRQALKVRAPTSIAPFPIEPSVPAPGIPRAALPGLPQATGRTLALEVEGTGPTGAKAVHPAAERVTQSGERQVRIAQVHEKLDLSFVDEQGGLVRLRVTMLPGTPPKLNVKGLTCFVARPGQRATPAVTIGQDGSLEMVSATRQVLGELTWWFGQKGPDGHVFVVDGRPLLVPYSEGQQAVALMLNRGNDIVVMCRR